MVMSCVQRTEAHLKRKRSEEWAEMGGLLANVRPTPGFMSLTQPRSLLMSMTHTTKGRENRAVQVGPATHWLKHSGERVLHLARAAQQIDPACRHG